MHIRYQFHDGIELRKDNFESDGMDVPAQIILHAAENHSHGIISAFSRGAPRPKPLEIASKNLKLAGVKLIDYWVDGAPAAKPILVDGYEKI